MSHTYLSRGRRGARGKLAAAGLLALAGALAFTLLAGPAEAAKRRPFSIVKTMTRNLYLGSDLEPGLGAASLDELCDGAREILQDVDGTRPALRMRAIANEILRKRPDLVGLQEAAAWYLQSPGDGRPPQILGGGGTFATTPRYDYLRLLLRFLNRRGFRYRVVAVTREFEFETEADLNGVPADSPHPGSADCQDAEADARLLMRDAILVRNRAGVRVGRRGRGNYRYQLALDLVGFPFAVKRGWQWVNVRVRGSRWLRFVNTHLEAFDEEASGNTLVNTANGATAPVSRGTVRRIQAQELVRGPARTGLPVVLVGDLNSNLPGVQPGDHQAFLRVLRAGFRRRSTQRPPSCCTDVNTGTVAGFDHVVDHILANRRFVRPLRSMVTGRRKVGPVFPSDHAGVWSSLLVPRPLRRR